jgi:F-type H+-transporting ATPase subunit delta
LKESTLQSKRYSRAIFEIALERKELDKWQSDLQSIVLLAENPDFLSVMDNPGFSLENKSKLLSGQLKGINSMAFNLATILISKNNFGLIVAVCADFQDILDDYRGIQKAEVTTAVPLDEKGTLKLAEYLEAITGKKIILTLKVDPQIIGGIIARVAGKIIDGSTSTQLAALRNDFASAGR